MSEWKRWTWPGIIATLLLTGIAALWWGPSVENDLAGKVKAKLADQFAWANVELDGRDLTLKGTAPNQQAIDSALKLADEAYDVRVVDNATDMIAEQSPYVFSAEKTGDSLVLGGFVPTDQDRMATIEAAKAAAGDLNIVDNMQLGRGASDNYGDLSAFAIGQLGRFSTGRAALSDNKLTVEGTALNSSDYDAANSELGGELPNGLELAAKNIMPAVVSPYEWTADYDGETLTLGGYVPDEKTRSQLMEQVKAALPDAQVKDGMKLAAGAGNAYAPSVGFAFERLADMAKGNAQLKDGKLSISGQAASLGSYDTALAALKAPPQGIMIASSKLDPANVDGYTMSATKTGDSIILSGFAPDDETIAAFEATAKEKAGGATVENKLKVAAGVPEGMNWKDAGSFAVSALSGFDTGSATIANRVLSVDGIASNDDAYQAANALLEGDLAGGMKLGKANIKAPVADPFDWMVMRDDSGATIKGYVPDMKSAEANVAYAKRAFGIDGVTDEQKVASGAPAGFGDAVSLALQSTSRLKNAKGNISGNKMMISGEAENEKAAAALDSEIKDNLPKGFTAETDISFKKAPEPEPEPVATPTPAPSSEVSVEDCRKMFKEALADKKIDFESAEATLTSDSRDVLTKLIDAAKSCPGTRIEISGHTDATGSRETNMKLSQKRAEVVKQYLEDGGIAGERVTAKGYGPDRPIGDNKTEEGKAANRRIEFRVLK